MSTRVNVDEFKKMQRKTARERLENKLAEALTAAGIVFKRKVKFDVSRNWEADFRIFDRFGIGNWLVEVEGGQYTRGRHQRPRGYQADCEKYNAAALLGYRVLRFTTEHIERRMDYVIETIRKAIRG